MNEEISKMLVSQLGESDNKDIKEMVNILVELKGTKAWDAIKWYRLIGQRQIQVLLGGMDPVKDPTSMARNQGMLLGLASLENYIESEVSSRKAASDEENAKNKAKAESN